ncbi:hypothetical protein [Terrisporobacter sp.]|uniref:hypothetical protein n=1 Tax=Terrisporobacter sp. TaxID=1965305 RepID=UPI0026208572|nr:hypothetical protein [Terrisporobacter sp.]
MNIIKNEIKKIFNPINMIVAALITIIIWFLFISFNIEHFQNGSDIYDYDTSVYMLKNYGTSMDEEEFKDFKLYREEKIKEANRYLLSDEEFAKENINSYEDYIKFRSKMGYNQKADKLISKVMFEDNVEVFWELQSLDNLIESYEDKEFLISSNYEEESSAQKARHEEIKDSNGFNSPLNFMIFRNYNSLIFGINLLVLICIPILICPIFINDNKNKVNYIQYTTKTGRKLFIKKVIASLISSIVITTIHLGILFTVYKSNNTYMFWDCSISSFISAMSSWYDITFGQYIILSVILTYIVSIITSIVTICVSSRTSTYISAIGIQIPILFIFGCWLKAIGMDYLTTTYYPKYILYIIYGLLILISSVMLIRRIKREKVSDI